MTGQQVRWTAEQVLALAPDAASRKAGGKLATPGPWSRAAQGEGALWGLCRGSGSKPYQTVVDLVGAGYKCSCPSRKFPCKHALALLLLWAEKDPVVADGAGPESVPDWAEKWLSGRRERAEAKAARPAGEAPADPEAARRRAERRAQRITAGAEELEQRLADLLRTGLAGAEHLGYAEWDETAARMVDAQAPGLATRVRELASIPGSGPGWPGRLLADCALLRLLTQGYLRRDQLPQELAATVRAQVGLSTDAATLLADENARLAGDWLVLGQRDSQEGRLTVRRVWLMEKGSGRFALVLSFGAAGQAPELVLPVGTVFEASLAYYPGGSPLRAVLGEGRSAPVPASAPEGVGVEAALTRYGEALRSDPWIEAWPAVLHDVVPLPPQEGAADGWRLADSASDAAVPLSFPSESARWQLAAISGGTPITVFGECGHGGFLPQTVWSDGEAITL
ncbi:SWIM zinc finger family protein [Streptomyces sp. XM4193]|uniref:SWIM zinc finger family protein n=1 Tax=Streptomyces sp. XM4193 TaxID=2929782 RepID=UPI001FF8A51F|nr:SWIM zinc finger family protein [Streptomyces sp. XM4193]MCK1795524.1 SWIM zinc finger family protein [Streptomyces sp. XM4193]